MERKIIGHLSVEQDAELVNSKGEDRLPEFMHMESLPPHDVVLNVDDEALDKVYGEL